MKWWRDITPIVRRIVALAMLAAFADAAALRADDVECEAVDTDGLPRDCTFSEQLGKCGWEAWQSWIQCIDEDGDGIEDAELWEGMACDFWAAMDLLACGLIVPWDLVLGKD